MEELKIPTYLKHKPVVTVENYSNIDGREAYKSDARGLSIGMAQWNARGRTDMSAKVWRTSGDHWSRLSEELPIHRLMDLCILYCRTKEYFAQSYRLPKHYDPEAPVIERIGMQGDAMTVSICTDNDHIDEDVMLLLDAMARDDEYISERLFILGDMLKRMGYVRGVK